MERSRRAHKKKSGAAADVSPSARSRVSAELALTVVVCTLNRAEFSRKAVQSLLDQKAACVGQDFEILIVDNASTDNTAALLKEHFEKIVGFRYVFEPVLGLSRARNTGWQNARGRWVAYLDDDALAVPGWVASILEAAAKQSQPPIGILGGQIDLDYSQTPPVWLPAELQSYLGLLRNSDTFCQLKRDQYVGGGNSAYPRDLLVRLEGFKENLGRRGKNLLSNEEVELRDRIEGVGYATYYEPGMRILHYVGPERLQADWYVRRTYWEGISNAVQLRLRESPSLLSRCGRAATNLLRIALRFWYVLHFLRPVRQAAVLRKRCFLVYNLGYARGMLMSL